MTDNAHDGRMADYLDGIDAADDWTPEGAGWDGFSPSYDEWIALRLLAGLAAGTFTEYLAAIGGEAADDYQPWTLDGNGSIVRAAPLPTCPTCGHAVTVLSTGEAGCWRCLGYWKDRAALDAATCERMEE